MAKIVAVMVCCAVMVFLNLPEQCASRFIKRSIKTTICSKSTPCGWEIYSPSTREIEFFMDSPCECPKGTECSRYSDDISISAYVFRCQTRNTMDDTE